LGFGVWGSGVGGLVFSGADLGFMVQSAGFGM